MSSMASVCCGQREVAKETRARASLELQEARLKQPALAFGTAAATPGAKKVVFGADRSLGLRLGSDDPLDQLWLEVDQDGDGELDRGEVLQLLQMMGRADAEAQIDGVMQGLDEDGSGNIDLGEFEDWYRRQPDGHVRRADALAPVWIESIGAYAAKRGLRPGMRILSLQGHDTQAMTLRDVTKLLEQAGRPLTMEFDTSTTWQRGKPGGVASKVGGAKAPSAVGAEAAGDDPSSGGGSAARLKKPRTVGRIVAWRSGTPTRSSPTRDEPNLTTKPRVVARVVVPRSSTPTRSSLTQEARRSSTPTRSGTTQEARRSSTPTRRSTTGETRRSSTPVGGGAASKSGRRGGGESASPPSESIPPGP